MLTLVVEPCQSHVTVAGSLKVQVSPPFGLVTVIFSPITTVAVKTWYVAYSPIVSQFRSIPSGLCTSASGSPGEMSFPKVRGLQDRRAHSGFDGPTTQ